MKEYIKKDVGDYFFERTNDFELSPPEHIWNNIRKEIGIPQVPVKPHFVRFWQYYAISAIISIIGIYTFNNFNAENSNLSSNNIIDNEKVTTPIVTENIKTIDNSINSTAKDINKNDVIVNNSVAVETQKKQEFASNVSEKIIEKVNSTKNSEIAINTNNELKSNETSNPVAISSVKKYNISASTFKNVKQIFFVNDSGEKSLVINNPSVNKFGFFEIDVTKLLSGRYKIKVVTEKEEIEHKIENF